MTLNVLSSVHAKPLSALLRGLKTPYADQVLRDLQSGKTKSEFPPVETSSDVFMRDYLAYNILRKSRVDYFGHPSASDATLVQEAVSSFLRVEKTCAYWNKHGYIPGTAPSNGMLAPEVVFQTAKRKIAQLLGDFDLNLFAEHIDFSSGSSTRLPKRNSGVPVKFTGKPHVTRSCALLAVSLMWHNVPWRLYCQERFGRESDPCTWVEVVSGSVYFTVPKTSYSLRGAAQEPELNMLCQKGIGSLIRKALKRVRIDLDDQTHNQYLARCGSHTGALATIDLEAASDSVALRLVKDLLPPDWYRFIEMTRSAVITLPDGTQHTVEKVSSMGNGFTFELESLIFWALTSSVAELRGCTDRRIGVYGDDIITHHENAPDVINCLAYCGFTVNSEKTWISGPFRESCGAHWYYGVNVTPFFIKEDLEFVENRFHLINNINEWVYRLNDNSSISYAETHDYVVRKLLPSRWGFIPPHYDTKYGIIPDSHVTAARKVSQASNDVCGFAYEPRLPGHMKYVVGKDGKRKGIWVPGSKTREVRATSNYLAWLLKAQSKGCGGEPSQVAIVEEDVVWRTSVRYTSMWSDSDVSLPRVLCAL